MRTNRRDLLEPMVLTWVSMGLKAGVTQDTAYAFTCLGSREFLLASRLIFFRLVYMSDPDASLSRAAYEAGQLGRRSSLTTIIDHNRFCDPLY